MFLDKKTLVKIWLKPGLILTIFRGNGPWMIWPTVSSRAPNRNVFVYVNSADSDQGFNLRSGPILAVLIHSL